MSTLTTHSGGRWVLYAIVGIPLIVIALSSLLYWLADSRRVDLGTVNNGELIIPPLQFAEAELKTLQGAPYLFGDLEPKWMFLVIGDQACQNACERMLYLARQSLVALGKRMNRVRLGYLSYENAIGPALQQRLIAEYPGIERIALNQGALQQLLGDTPQLPNSFYVVDPQGWLMMRYQADDLEQAALNDLGKAIVKDMKRLIK